MAIDADKLAAIGGVMVQDNTIKLNKNSILKLLEASGITIPAGAKIYLPLVVGIAPPFQKDVSLTIDETASIVVEWSETTGAT